MKFMNDSGDAKKNIPVTQQATNSTAPSTTVVGVGVTLVGKIVATGAVEIQGQIKGDVETNAQVVIAESGIVEGIIKATTVIVKGAVSGEIHAKEIVRLTKTARLRANLVAGQLEMEGGAELIGSCSVSGASSSNVDQVKPVLQKVAQ